MLLKVMNKVKFAILMLAIAISLKACFLAKKTYRYKFDGTSSAILFEIPNENIYHASITVFYKRTCPIELNLIAKLEKDLSEFQRLNVPIELKEMSGKVEIFDGDWYGEPWGLEINHPDCVEELEIEVEYYY